MPDDRWTAHLAGRPFHPSQLTEGANLTAVWAARWASEPSAPTLLVEGADGGPHAGAGADAGGGQGRWCTAAALDACTRAAAGRLAQAGLGAGERVLWSAGASFDALVACVAALRLGAVVVPVNPASTEREVAHLASDVRPALAVVGRDEQARWVTGATPSCVVLGPGLDALAGTPPRAAEPAAPLTLDAAASDDPALVVYTSGTTGTPKGAVLSQANLLAGVRAIGLAWRWDPGDRLVLALPLFHVHGLVAGLFGTLTAGGSAVVLPRFSPEGVLGAVSAHRASLFFGVPTMYRRLLGAGRAGELARLRLCVSGSAPLPAPMWEEVRRATGVAVLERYGMTETVLTVSNPYEGERRPGTVGFPLPGVEVRTVDAGVADGFEGGGVPGTGQGSAVEGSAVEGSAVEGSAVEDSAAGGSEGQLLVAGPSVFAGYWERPAATAAAFDGPWFRTGDVVGADADGYLAVRGRRSDVVISGGFNVYPAEVEDVLLGHPGVAEVAVVGQPSDDLGETVVAWVVPDGARPDSDALEAFASERLAPYKQPRCYRFLEALPRNAMGKVRRDLLRDG